MPTYTYECRSCQSQRDVTCRIADRPNYIRCRECGKRADRVFLPLQVQTDGAILSGMGTILDQCDGDKRQADRLVAKLRAKGARPSYNDIYLPTVAQEEADPRALFKAHDGKAAIKKACEQMDISCEQVKSQRRARAPLPSKPLSEKAIRQLAQQAIKQDPVLGEKPTQELREQIIDTHSMKR